MVWCCVLQCVRYLVQPHLISMLACYLLGGYQNVLYASVVLTSKAYSMLEIVDKYPVVTFEGVKQVTSHYMRDFELNAPVSTA